VHLLGAEGRREWVSQHNPAFEPLEIADESSELIFDIPLTCETQAQAKLGFFVPSP
jgi:hypothetical protein